VSQLSSTSEMVLLWAGEDIYRTVIAKDYLRKLNLNSKNFFYQQCNKICSYYDEVIKNRKFGVLNLVNKCFTSNEKITQLIIAGAGLDPLGIEVNDLYPDIKVFELDYENMETKFNLLTVLGDISKLNISFITTNLLNPSEVVKSLTEHGWSSEQSTLLILEGISYYLPRKTLRDFIKVINPAQVVFEFLKVKDEINSENNKIAEQVFKFISDSCGFPEIVRYSHSQFEELFNLAVLKRYGMKKLERMRSGTNKYFPTEESGWIEVCLLGRG
jgi:hypothetical protein